MSRNEFFAVTGIIVVLAILAGFNFRSALVKGRDIQRKNDLKHIAAALKDYMKDAGYFPTSENGKILACMEDPSETTVCLWGKHGVPNPENPAQKYINPLPQDPFSGKGYEYFYISNTKNFQIYAHLERESDAEYNERILHRGLWCGQAICNFGVGSSSDVRLEGELPELPTDE